VEHKDFVKEIEPSVAAFLAMVTNPDYQEIHVHGANALERAELIATVPGTLS
jgi:hypothetical protein